MGIRIGNKLAPYEDPKHPGNSPNYHTGKLCVEGCGRPAGTAWSPLWCQPCNAARMKKISAQLEEIAAEFKRKNTNR